MVKSLTNLSKRLWALAILTSMASSQLLAPPRKAKDTKSAPVESTVSDAALELAKVNAELEAQIAALMAAAKSDISNLNTTQEATQDAITQEQDDKSESNNPFRKVNYYDDKVIINFNVSGYSIEFDCGPGGSGDIREQLPAITCRVTKSDTAEIASWDTEDGDDESSIGLKEVIAALLPRLTKSFPALNAGLSLITDAISGNLEETIPAGVNLCLRMLIVLNSDLDINDIASELITLIGRYKLTLLEDVQHKDVLDQARKKINDLKTKIATSTRDLNTAKVRRNQAEINKLDAEIKAAEKAVTAIEESLKKALKELNSTKSSGRFAAIGEHLHNAFFDNDKAVVLAKKTTDEKGLSWVWDIFSSDYKIELTPKEKKSLGVALTDAEKKELGITGKYTPKLISEADEKERGPLAMKLILQALQNTHNNVARKHHLLTSKTIKQATIDKNTGIVNVIEIDNPHCDLEYKKAQRAKLKETRASYTFLNTQAGKKARNEVNQKIIDLKKKYVKPTTTDKEAFLTQDLELKIQLRDQLRTFYVLEKARKSGKLITPSTQEARIDDKKIEKLKEEKKANKKELKRLNALEAEEEAKDEINENTLISIQDQKIACEQRIAQLETQLGGSDASVCTQEIYKVYIPKLDAVINKITEENKELRKLLELRKKTTKTAQDKEAIKKLNLVAKKWLKNPFPLPTDQAGTSGAGETLEKALRTSYFSTEHAKFKKEISDAMILSGYKDTTTGELDGPVKLALNWILKNRPELKKLHAKNPNDSDSDLE